jgi:hypothetical protein
MADISVQLKICEAFVSSSSAQFTNSSLHSSSIKRAVWCAGEGTVRSCLPCAFCADSAACRCCYRCLPQVIGSQIERLQDDNACLAYWLTNTVTLLHLLQRNIKPASGSGSVKRVAQAAGRSIMGGLFGRQPMGGAWPAALQDDVCHRHYHRRLHCPEQQQDGRVGVCRLLYMTERRSRC